MRSALQSLPIEIFEQSENDDSPAMKRRRTDVPSPGTPGQQSCASTLAGEDRQVPAFPIEPPTFLRFFADGEDKLQLCAQVSEDGSIEQDSVVWLSCGGRVSRNRQTENQIELKLSATTKIVLIGASSEETSLGEGELQVPLHRAITLERALKWAETQQKCENFGQTLYGHTVTKAKKAKGGFAVRQKPPKYYFGNSANAPVGSPTLESIELFWAGRGSTYFQAVWVFRWAAELHTLRPWGLALIARCSFDVKRGMQWNVGETDPAIRPEDLADEGEDVTAPVIVDRGDATFDVDDVD